MPAASSSIRGVVSNFIALTVLLLWVFKFPAWRPPLSSFILSAELKQDHTRSVPGECSVQKNDDHVFSLTGSWHDNSTLAALVDQQAAQSNICRPKAPVYPFNLHGCCSAKINAPTEYRQAVFCPRLLDSNKSAAVDSFLEATRNHTVVFFGDSLTLQMFAAVEMQLRDNSIPFEHFNQHRNQTILVPSTNSTIQLLEYYRLENVNRTGFKIEQEKKYSQYNLRDEELLPFIQQATILINNNGLHEADLPEYHYLQYKHVQEMVLQENKVRQQQGRQDLCLLWRRTLPQHFASNDGGGRYERAVTNHFEFGCKPLNRTWEHPSDQGLKRVQSDYHHRTPVLDFTSLLANAHAFHSIKTWDCSHYCYSPLLWNPILHLTAEVLRQTCS